MLHGSFRVADAADRGAVRQEQGQRAASRVVTSEDRIAGDGFEFVQVRLDAEHAVTNELARYLSPAERRRADRFVFERDRHRFIVGRARLRELLALRLETRAESIELDCGPRGKPRLSGNFACADLRFNLSHCADVALYVFTHGREIGVDIELVRELPDADEVAARFFSRHEREAYRALAPHDRPLGFFRCWTRKEAFIKALGDGLHFPLNAFDVSLAPGEPARILRVADVGGSACGWTLHEVELGLGSSHVASVVVGDSE